MSNLERPECSSIQGMLVSYTHKYLFFSPSSFLKWRKKEKQYTNTVLILCFRVYESCIPRGQWMQSIFFSKSWLFWVYLFVAYCHYWPLRCRSDIKENKSFIALFKGNWDLWIFMLLWVNFHSQYPQWWEHNTGNIHTSRLLWLTI